MAVRKDGTVSPAYKHTTSQDGRLEWKAPAKELGVGQTMNGSRGMFNKMVFLGQLNRSAFHIGPTAGISGENSTRNDGDEDSEGWDEGRNLHVCGRTGKNVWV